MYQKFNITISLHSDSDILEMQSLRTIIESFGLEYNLTDNSITVIFERNITFIMLSSALIEYYAGV